MRRIVGLVVVAAMVLAACGSSSKKSVNPAGSGATGTTASGTSGTGGTGGTDDLSKLAGDYAKAKIKITYSSGSGGDNFTIAQDGNGKSAYTIGNNTFYSDGTKSISCEGTGPTAKCTDLGSVGAAGGTLGNTLPACSPDWRT